MENVPASSEESRASLPTSAPFLAVSLVIPVRNEEKSVPILIESIRKQLFSPAEVIIVDGGSTDETVRLAAKLTEGDERFRVIEAGAATPGRGRNVGTAAALCEWVAYTDAGIRLEPNWLERLVAEVRRDLLVEVVYGDFEPVTETFFERCAALAYVPARQTGPERNMRGPFIASSLLRRDVWQRVGGFPDLRAAEDLMFMEQIEAAGFRIAWARKATVYWQLQPTLARTFKKFILYSRHNVWAGRQRYWHYGIARQYAMALPFIVLALIHSPWWLIVPALGLIFRALKSIWRRREARGLLWLLNPLQLLSVLLIIFTIDLATFIGWAQALWQQPPVPQEVQGL